MSSHSHLEDDEEKAKRLKLLGLVRRSGGFDQEDGEEGQERGWLSGAVVHELTL